MGKRSRAVSAPGLAAEAPHARTAEEVLSSLGSGTAGLSAAEAAARLHREGPNRLTSRRGRSALRRVLDQVIQPLVLVLVVAAVVSAALGDTVDAAVIAAVVAVNVFIGFLQESRAENAIAALDALVVTQATVVRDGERRRISGEDLVRGDVVALQSGDAVPADLRLLSARDLQVEEAALTGESVPAPKDPAPLPATTGLADRGNMVFAGTAVTYGTATGVVVATGDATAMGQIAGMIAAAREIDTPLTRRLAHLSRVVLWIILAAAAVMIGIQLARGQVLADAFNAAVAFAVGAIPEGLPAAVTILLAVGVSKLARRGAIIRRLPAVETLGSTTVVCSDKTGTLTENQMTVTRVWMPHGELSVSGAGYDLAGGFERGGRPIDASAASEVGQLLRCAALCQDTRVRREGDRVVVEGDPTEAALIVMASKGGVKGSSLPRLDAIPFESAHMYMATLHPYPEGGGTALYVKGSTDALLARCQTAISAGGAVVPLDRGAVQQAIVSLAQQGLRVLCLARRLLPHGKIQVGHDDVSELTLLGLVGMIDPPRPAARTAIATCQRAGIAVKMITGDHAVTAAAIARDLGLEGQRSSDGRLAVLTGEDLARLKTAELATAADRVAVFARVAPEQKLALVDALRARGHVVAMTGDGVNDAPALKQADIGVAMGRGGTDVARGAAAMVLTDDNFATIEAAVEEGRGVYDNLLKFVAWTLPTNGGEGLVILAAVVAGVTLPILPVQMLWVNMATAVLLGTTLVFEPKEPGLMERPPRPAGAPILSRALALRVLFVSSLVAAFAFGLFEWSLHARPGHVEEARTVAANAIVVVEVGYLLACRSLVHPAWRLGWFSNPWIWVGCAGMLVLQLVWTYLPLANRLFHTAPLGWHWWVAFTAAGASVFLAVEAKKGLARRRGVAPGGVVGSGAAPGVARRSVAPG